MAKSVAEIITEDIVRKLEEGTVPWHKAWSSPTAAPRNAISNNKYRGFNIFWLGIQGYRNPFWASFNQIKQRGGHIKKDERHTKVTYFKINKKEEVSDDGEITERSWRMLRYYQVWNLEQTEGCKLPKKAQEFLDTLEVVNQNHNPIQACENIWNNYVLPPKLEFNGNPCYIPSKDTIRMPELSRFDSAPEYYSTLFHEVGHSTMHFTRLDRKESYAKEELIAEITACFLCGEAGIDKHILDNSAAYIDGWRKRITDDPKIVLQSASAAQKARDFILNEGAFESRLTGQMKEAIGA